MFNDKVVFIFRLVRSPYLWLPATSRTTTVESSPAAPMTRTVGGAEKVHVEGKWMCRLENKQYLKWISGWADQLMPQKRIICLLAGSSSLPWKSVLPQDLEAVRWPQVSTFTIIVNKQFCLFFFFFCSESWRKTSSHILFFFLHHVSECLCGIVVKTASRNRLWSNCLLQLPPRFLHLFQCSSFFFCSFNNHLFFQNDYHTYLYFIFIVTLCCNYI